MPKDVTDAAKQQHDIAVIGYAARLPGAPDVDAVWNTLKDGRCNVGLIPDTRWSHVRYYDPNRDAPGKTYARHAGLIDDVYDFDANYFGLSPREAEQMDPQQRMLLEVVARAFDHAGLDPARLEKTRTGVFVGASSSDHSTVCLQDPAMVDAQFMLGNTLSIFSNRISFQWDLKGPSYTVDTACSSGLFALDQARRAIAAGEIDTAIVGSVNVLLSPMPFIGFAKASMLSETGLCQAFGAGADGYVRAEGAVALILRRADLAKSGRDRIRSYLAGTGTNSDGRTPGIAMPSSDRQIELLEEVKWRFDIDPERLAFVEAHGTGTAVGDPEEARAIGTAYGQHRSTPLSIGSAKTNFGHLEPAAGLVGVLKAQLALEHGVLPPSLHSEDLNPHIPFEDLGLDVARTARPLPKSAEPWLAAINSFGFGGANAHAILRQAPSADRPQVEQPKSLILTAASKESLRALAEEWRGKVAEAPPDLHLSTATANARLARHRHRLCLPAASAERLGSALDGWLDGRTPHGVVQGVAGSGTGKVGFVFSGNGSQWAGMGRYMLLNDDVFHKGFVETSDLAQKYGTASLLDLIMSSDLDALLERSTVAQPLLLGVQIATVDALAAKGVRPTAVLGHSAGEVAAAYAAGAITRDQAVRIIVARSFTLDRLFNRGGMAAIAGDEKTVGDLIAAAGLDVDIAAENSAGSITVSGSTKDLAHLIALCRKNRIAGKTLAIAYPYHSRMTELLRTELLEELAGISGRDGEAAIYSGCRGVRITGKDLTADYWWENARNKVRFREGVQEMARDGVSVFLEISPNSVLQAYVRDSLEEGGATGSVLGSLEKTNAKEIDATSITLGVLAHGGRIDEAPLLSAATPTVGDLPPYPFDRRPFRMASAAQRDLFGQRPQHDLLGGRVDPASAVWTADLSVGRLPWLADHVVDGHVLLPATGILEMFLAAARDLSDGPVELRNLEILRPIEFDGGRGVSIRVTHDAVADRLTLEMRSYDEWVWVAGAALTATEKAMRPDVDLADGAAAPGLYDMLSGYGLDYGKAFARVDRVAVDGSGVDVSLAPGALSDDMTLDPTGADAVLHALLMILGPHVGEGDRVFVPGRLGRVRWFGGGAVAGGRLTLRSATPHGACVDVVYVDDAGIAVAEIRELRLRPLPAASTERTVAWDERAVLLSRGRSTAPVDATRQFRDDDAAPQDLEVIRDAIGGRLAWDIVTSSTGQTDRRYETALDALRTLDLIGPDETAIPATAECPWPDLSTLVRLLIDTHPQATAEIRATLHGMVSDRCIEDAAIDDLRAAALDLLDAPDGTLGRVLLTGRIDPAVFARAMRAADTLVVGVDTQAHAETLSLGLDDAERCRITVLDEIAERSEFDLVLGVGVGSVLSPRLQKRVTTFEGGGSIVLIDTAVDLFALMTGLYLEADCIEALDDMLSLAGVVGRRSAWRSAASVTLFDGTLRSGTGTSVPAATVLGKGPLADRLSAALPDGASGTGPTILVVSPHGDGLSGTLLSQAKALRALPGGKGPVWIVQDTPEGAAALRGWRRSLANETGRDIRTMTIGPDTDVATVLRLAATSPEREVHLAEGRTEGRRVIPAKSRHEVIGTGMKAVLAQTAPGRIASLQWQATPRTEPEATEVELAVTATALNYRDVMWAQGLLPSELLEGGFAGPSLGMECAGVVERAGPASGFAPGDRVLAFAPDGFASHVTVAATAAVRVPDGIDLTMAASLPVIFVTAEYALTDLARLQKGEWCLIHGGAGGVGLAAIQVARRAGARIIATAGSKEKRALLDALGVDVVCDSRSLEFVKVVEDVTEGRGVDVVLNSLAGQAMEQGIGCVAPFGRFVELGKRDFVANTAIGLRALKDNVSYFAVDADQLLRVKPAMVETILKRIMEAFSAGDYGFTPAAVYPSEMALDAFRTMQKSGHVGKILITPPAVSTAPAAAPADLSGTWLVTGGTKGFGFATARWLAANGADRLWLVSRSGTIEDPEALEVLRATGATVEIRAVDVTDDSAAAELVDEIAATGHGLDGVVNGAAVFDDAMFADADANRLGRVIRAKLDSALALDAATRRSDLRHFWLYSSIAARIGNVGQSAYVAANMELEALAERRRAEGLPGLAVAWGPIGDTGFLDRSADLREIIQQKMGTMTADEALGHLKHALDNGLAGGTLTLAPVEWSRLAGDLPLLSEPLFDHLDLQPDAAGGADTIDLAALIAKDGEAKARKVIAQILQREIGQIMHIAPSEIDMDRSLTELGFDSLMGLNLKMAMEQRLGRSTPLTSVGDGMTLSRLAHKIVAGAGQGETDATANDMAERHLADAAVPEDLKQRILNVAAD